MRSQQPAIRCSLLSESSSDTLSTPLIATLQMHSIWCMSRLISSMCHHTATAGALTATAAATALTPPRPPTGLTAATHQSVLTATMATSRLRHMALARRTKAAMAAVAMVQSAVTMPLRAMTRTGDKQPASCRLLAPSQHRSQAGCPQAAVCASAGPPPLSTSLPKRCRHACRNAAVCCVIVRQLQPSQLLSA